MSSLRSTHAALALVALTLAAACGPAPVTPADATTDRSAFPWDAARPDASTPSDAASDTAPDAPPSHDARPEPDASPPADADADVRPDAGPPAAPFSIVVLPDTQYYSAWWPGTFDTQTAWIAAERRSGNIAFVLTLGDIVDDDLMAQWDHASHSLHALDGLVPYVVTAGNHDYCCAGALTDRRTRISEFFPVPPIAMQPWFLETFEPGRIENAAYRFTPEGGSEPWLVLSLEFGPRDAVLAWANGILRANSRTQAIMVTHAYLYSDDTRYDHVNRPDQLWNPHSYPLATEPGAVNDGEQMWRALVLPNPNVRFVLSGHVLNDGVGRLTSTRPDGTVVHQLLSNYQGWTDGGTGFLRVMQFDPAHRHVRVRTYSPLLDRFVTDADNEFGLDY